MERVYKEAFTEVEQILKIMPIDLLSKIPIQFRKTISENKATDYNVTIEEPLEKQTLKKETIVILGLIYRDFLASPEEREQLQLKDAEELKRIEKEMQEQYDMKNIFENRKKQRNTDNNQTQNGLVIYKKTNFLEKIFNTIRAIFKKNKF